MPCEPRGSKSLSQAFACRFGQSAAQRSASSKAECALGLGVRGLQQVQQHRCRREINDASLSRLRVLVSQDNLSDIPSDLLPTQARQFFETTPREERRRDKRGNGFVPRG